LTTDKTKSYRLEVYVNSLIERNRLVDYAIVEVQSHQKRLLGKPSADIEDMITFYANAFWTFCYSQFDVLAHVSNVLFPVIAKEVSVGFLEYAKKAGVPKIVAERMNSIIEDKNFDRLRAYRQCYLHRRAVMFKYQASATDSRVYSTSVGTTDRLKPTTVMLGDDPQAIDPAKTRPTKNLLVECRRLNRFARDAIIAIQTVLEDAWNGEEENNNPEIDRT